MAPIAEVGVVIPVHDEAETLESTLRSIGVAAVRLGRPVSTLVVLDDCSDASASICARLGVATMTLRARNVGRARAEGCAALLGAGGVAGRYWLASTDADSVVPADWLVGQIALADSGADVVAGTVALAPDPGLRPGHRQAFARAYAARCDGDGHLHAHGANLGIRGSAYRSVGGFRSLTAHEDRDLLDRLLHRPGCWVARDSTHPVLTSARRRGRAPMGLAGDLHRLILEEPGIGGDGAR